MTYRSREPVRLGHTVFDSGNIEESIYYDLKEALIKFKNHMENHNVTKYRAVATSAMREAQNNKKIIDKLLIETGVKVEIISGDEEARLVALAIDKNVHPTYKHYLIIDIGGGSIELIALNHGHQLKKQSFVLGTVRLLQLDQEKFKKESLEKWLPDYLKDQLKDFFSDLPDLPICVGTGGNMDRFIKLKPFVSNQDGDFLTFDEMKSLYEKLNSVNYKDRIVNFSLKPDRADVIIPAAIATNCIMEMAHSKKFIFHKWDLKMEFFYELCSSGEN